MHHFVLNTGRNAGHGAVDMGALSDLGFNERDIDARSAGNGNKMGHDSHSVKILGKLRLVILVDNADDADFLSQGFNRLRDVYTFARRNNFCRNIRHGAARLDFSDIINDIHGRVQ